MTCSRILPLLAVSILSYEYLPSAFCTCPVASLAPGAWCLASTPSPPYPESHGAHVCGVWRRGEQRWKMLSLEAQVKDTDDLEPLTSPAGQSKGQPSALHEMCLRRLSHLRDMVPPAHGDPRPSPQAYLVKRGISSLMFTMFTCSSMEALSPWLSLTSTMRW